MCCLADTCADPKDLEEMRKMQKTMGLGKLQQVRAPCCLVSSIRHALSETACVPV